MANQQYRTSNVGLALIQAFEKFWKPVEGGSRAQAYDDGRGVLTIGWGHTGREVHSGLVITRQQAEDFLRRDLQACENAIKKFVKVELSQYQFDALVSFIFNNGAGAFKQSTLLSVLNAGNYGAVPTQLMRWVHVKGKVWNGLVRRRESEVSLWSAEPSEQVEVSPDGDVSIAGVVPTDEPLGTRADPAGPEKPITKSRTLAGAGANAVGAAGLMATQATSGGGAAPAATTAPSAAAPGVAAPAPTAPPTTAPPAAPAQPAPTAPSAAPPTAAPAAPAAPTAPQAPAAPATQTAVGAQPPPSPAEAKQFDHSILFWLFAAILVVGLLMVVFARFDDQSKAVH